MWNHILNLRWMALPCVEKNWLIFNKKISSQIESQMNNYMLLGRSSLFLFLLCSIFWALQRCLDQRFFFHLENLQLSLRCIIFFVLLMSCKCDSRLGHLLTFPWKHWWYMLFNSFSDMTLMICVETIVIKPGNISWKLVK